MQQDEAKNPVISITEKQALVMYHILKACIVENSVESARFYMRTNYDQLDAVMTFAARLYDTVPYDYSRPELAADIKTEIAVIDPKTGEKIEPHMCTMCTGNPEHKVNEAHKGE